MVIMLHSLTQMTMGTHSGMRPVAYRQNSVVMSMSLSARGSMTLPNFVTRL